LNDAVSEDTSDNLHFAYLCPTLNKDNDEITRTYNIGEIRHAYEIFIEILQRKRLFVRPNFTVLERASKE